MTEITLATLADLPDEQVKAALTRLPEEVRARTWRKFLKMRRDKEQNPIGWYRPLPKAEDFHRSTARWRVLVGGNRSSKTYSGAEEMILWLLGDERYREIPRGPLSGMIVGQSFDLMFESMIPIIRDTMPKNGSMRLTWSRDTKQLQGPNGLVNFKSGEQSWESFQARALDFFWMDEEVLFQIYRQLSKRLKGGSKLQGWFTLTMEPDRPDHWIYDELIVRARAGDPEVAHFEMDLEDNRISRGGYIDDSEIDRLIAETPVEDRPAVIHGKYVRRGGLVYPTWSRDVHVASEKSLREFLNAVNDGVYTPFCALDWGVRNPTAILLLLEDKESNVHLVDEIYRPAQSVNDIKEEYKKRFSIFKPIFIVADPSIWNNHDSVDPTRTIGGQLELDDYENKLPGLPLMAGDNDVTNGLEAVRELLRVHPQHGPKLRVQPRCLNFMQEIEGYVGEEWVSNAYAKNKKETPRKKGDHAMDAFRYFAMSPHMWMPKKWNRVRTQQRYNPVTGFPVRAGV